MNKCQIFRLHPKDLRFKQLFECSDPPQELYVECQESALSILEKLPRRGLAIVGTRNPQTFTLKKLEHWISQLAGSNLMVVSGFAEGVDAGAHRAAIRAGLKTVAVFGTALTQTYPAHHSGLRTAILESGGVIVSEVPPHTRIQSWQFLKRNRLIASWSEATWVVEAGQKSGALNTAKWARELGRSVFATPHFPDFGPYLGNQTLLDRDHAYSFYGPHSLGAVWLEISSHSPISEHPSEGLLAVIRGFNEAQGPIPVHLCYKALEEQNWDERSIFNATQQLLASGRIAEKNGHFVAL